MLRKLIRTYLEQYYEPASAIDLSVFYEKFISQPEKAKAVSVPKPTRFSRREYPEISSKKKGLMVRQEPMNIAKKQYEK